MQEKYLCVTQVRPYYIFVCNISMDKNISYSSVTNVRTLHIFFIMRILMAVSCGLKIKFYKCKCVMSFSVLLFSEFGQMNIKMFQKLRGSDSLVFKIWTWA